jgi:ribonuclease P protein component
MTRADDFRDTIRGGSRAGSDTLVVHLRVHRSEEPHGPRIGFIVSKTVGTAVVRNRVRRRLRHAAAPWTAELLPATQVVVRALPPAATASGVDLRAELDSCLRRASRKTDGAVPA